MTHSVTFLPQVDWIVLLDGGVVQEQGTYADLAAREGSEFAAFLQQHVKAHPSSASLARLGSGLRGEDKSVFEHFARPALCSSVHFAERLHFFCCAACSLHINSLASWHAL